MYTYHYNDGHTDETSSHEMNHVFSSAGVYTVNVTAYNNISTDSAQVCTHSICPSYSILLFYLLGNVFILFFL